MMYCWNCGCYYQGAHYCVGKTALNTYIPVVVQPRLIEGQKCSLCGSTAIDHTEKACKENRQIFPKEANK